MHYSYASRYALFSGEYLKSLSSEQYTEGCRVETGRERGREELGIEIKCRFLINWHFSGHPSAPLATEIRLFRLQNSTLGFAVFCGHLQVMETWGLYRTSGLGLLVVTGGLIAGFWLRETSVWQQKVADTVNSLQHKLSLFVPSPKTTCLKS